MLCFHGGTVLARCLVIIRRSWPTSPPPEKRKDALGGRQAIGIANLPDLRSPAFVRGRLKAAQPIQKAMIAQRLQRPHDCVTRPAQFFGDVIKGRVQSARLEVH